MRPANQPRHLRQDQEQARGIREQRRIQSRTNNEDETNPSKEERRPEN